MDDSLDLTILIPTYKGTQSLSRLLAPLVAELSSLGTGEILIILDDPNPQTFFELASLTTTYQEVRILQNSANRGQRIATLQGIPQARGRYTITMDDDGSHPPTGIRQLYNRAQELGPRSLVYGTCCSTEYRPVHRNLGTVLNTKLFQRYLGLPPQVRVGSFRCFATEFAREAIAIPVTFPYLSAQLLSRKPQVDQIFYEAPFDQPESRYTLLALVRLFWNLVLHWGPFAPLARRLFTPQALPALSLNKENQWPVS